ncbi:hypothetical protein GYMLUDRAFT_57686 [Collybiopsis luxurians FD-317 M1]|uniref:Uncharacterized protein n=1 Tax=Collybiopsis luxurians FD-317 M1 TaxID=944289 RepID=A0A0D0BHT3_9AGAR|nr:hypothetical protein GYMLUDRAFT_57686 [Collybiopsis luxurians FD-317 M1]
MLHIKSNEVNDYWIILSVSMICCPLPCPFVMDTLNLVGLNDLLFLLQGESVEYLVNFLYQKWWNRVGQFYMVATQALVYLFFSSSPTHGNELTIQFLHWQTDTSRLLWNSSFGSEHSMEPFWSFSSLYQNNENAYRTLEPNHSEITEIRCTEVEDLVPLPSSSPIAPGPSVSPFSVRVQDAPASIMEQPSSIRIANALQDGSAKSVFEHSKLQISQWLQRLKCKIPTAVHLIPKAKATGRSGISGWTRSLITRVRTPGTRASDAEPSTCGTEPTGKRARA